MLGLMIIPSNIAHHFAQKARSEGTTILGAPATSMVKGFYDIYMAQWPAEAK